MHFCTLHMPLYVLLYQSSAARPLKIRDLLDIYGTALRNNPAHDITGLLTYAESDPYAEDALPDQFMQWLEGPEDQVTELFQRICEDPRHQNVRVLGEGPADALHGHDIRLFPDWAMGLDMNDALPSSVEAFFTYLSAKGLSLNYRPSFSSMEPPEPSSPPEAQRDRATKRGM